MQYLALLRGINVGGKARVEMPKLKGTFERLGYSGVVTYINSGNVVFSTNVQPATKLAATIEAAIRADFGFAVPVVVRDEPAIAAICQRVPTTWVNDTQTMKTDVMFLWEAIDTPDILSRFKIKPEIEQLIYVGGALVWNVGREHINQGAMIKVVGTDIYRHMTVRNINTVRKLAELMAAPASAA